MDSALTWVLGIAGPLVVAAITGAFVWIWKVDRIVAGHTIDIGALHKSVNTIETSCAAHLSRSAETNRLMSILEERFKQAHDDSVTQWAKIDMMMAKLEEFGREQAVQASQLATLYRVAERREHN